MGYTYEQYLRDMMKQAQEEQAAYEASRRAQAQAAVSAVTQTYDAAKEQATTQYRRAAQEEERAYRELYDANAVDELVARRDAEEAISNSGLLNSGLNHTQQTAISLQRSRADSLTREQQQRAVAAIMQKLDDLRASYDQQAAEKKASLYAQADNDVRSNLYTLTKEARERAAKLYDEQQQREYEALEAQRKREFEAQEAEKQRDFEASEAHNDRDHEWAMEVVKQANDSFNETPPESEPASLTEQMFDPNKHGTRFADFNQKPSLTAIRADAWHELRTNGNNAAWRFLEQRVRRQYITEMEMNKLAAELGIKKPPFPTPTEIAAKVNEYIMRLNRKAAMEYIRNLHEQYLIYADEAYEWYRYIGMYPEE